MGTVVDGGILVTDASRYTCTVNVSDEAYDLIATFAHRHKLTHMEALDRVLGDEGDWQALVDAMRVPRAPNLGRPPAQHPWDRCACCAPGRCKHPFSWRGTTRCACPKT